MTSNSNYIRKVIYIALIGILLVPVSFLSRPTTRNKDNNIQDSGGVISQLRNDYELSQAKLSEIDAASEALRFSLLGMRGVASTSLWLQAIEAKEKEDWNTFEATLNTLVKIQPNFVRVWQYQAHNLSYNVSAEFDDFEFRYAWVKKGLHFLTEGIPYNRRDHRITDNLGFFTGQKIGRSDEKVQFRQLFRRDSDFHESMSRFPFIHEDNRGQSLGFRDSVYGPDNWLLAHQWYERSLSMVANGVENDPVTIRSAPYLFFMWSPAQLRNQPMSLQKEVKPSQHIQRILWQENALKSWLEFGQVKMKTSRGVVLTLEGMEKSSRQIQALREKLDALAPGKRAEFEKEVMDYAGLTDEERVILRKDNSDLDDEEQIIARRARNKIFQIDRQVDKKVSDFVSDDKRFEAKRLVKQIYELIVKRASIGRYAGVTNYPYWKQRALGESSEKAFQARMAIYSAEEKERKSQYDRFVSIDPKTKRPRIDPKTKKPIIEDGAIQDYERGFKIWAEVLEKHPDLKSGDLVEDLIEHMQHFYVVLRVSQKDWPLDFPLQYIIDRRAKLGEGDGIPSTEKLQARREMEKAEKEKSDEKDPLKKESDNKSEDEKDKSEDKKDADKKADDSKKDKKPENKSDSKKSVEKKSDDAKKSDDKPKSNEKSSDKSKEAKKESDADDKSKDKKSDKKDG